MACKYYSYNKMNATDTVDKDTLLIIGMIALFVVLLLVYVLVKTDSGGLKILYGVVIFIIIIGYLGFVFYEIRERPIPSPTPSPTNAATDINGGTWVIDEKGGIVFTSNSGNIINVPLYKFTAQKGAVWSAPPSGTVATSIAAHPTKPQVWYVNSLNQLYASSDIKNPGEWIPIPTLMKSVYILDGTFGGDSPNNLVYISVTSEPNDPIFVLRSSPKLPPGILSTTIDTSGNVYAVQNTGVLWISQIMQGSNKWKKIVNGKSIVAHPTKKDVWDLDVSSELYLLDITSVNNSKLTTQAPVTLSNVNISYLDDTYYLSGGGGTKDVYVGKTTDNPAIITWVKQ